MQLAIETDLWQQATDHEPYAYAIFERQRPDYKIVRTDPSKPLAFDGWIMQGERKVALVETKCREHSYQDFTTKLKMQWLLSESKLAALAKCSRSWDLPTYGFLYFINCKKLMTIQLVNKQGAIIERELKTITTEEKYLQATDTRLCGLVAMHKATLLQWHGTPISKKEQ